MVSWDEKKATRHSDQEEFDIDNIDPAVFDDPVLLLEYLEKQELQKKKSSAYSTQSTQRSPGSNASSSSNLPQNRGAESSALYGYDLIRGEYRINPEQAEAVIEIISLYESGYSYSQIVYLLGDTKHRTVTGKKFYPAAVQMIVKNKRVYEGKTGYPPILTPKKVSAQAHSTAPGIHSNVSSTVSTSQKQNSGYGSPYIEAIEKMRKSIEQRKEAERQRLGESEKKVYRSIDDFLDFIKSKGIPVKDNRWNDGCVWVRADVAIADIMAHVVIKGRGFRYSPKCKAFNGGPGWYY